MPGRQQDRLVSRPRRLFYHRLPPATVVMNTSETLRTRPLPPSAMYRLPAASRAMPYSSTGRCYASQDHRLRVHGDADLLDQSVFRSINPAALISRRGVDHEPLRIRRPRAGLGLAVSRRSRAGRMSRASASPTSCALSAESELPVGPADSNRSSLGTTPRPPESRLDNYPRPCWRTVAAP